MKRIAIIAAKRSPVGKIPGELNYISEIELLSCLFKDVSSGLERAVIDEAYLGTSFPIERDNLCRKAILHAGLSSEINAITISKTCASSDEALQMACNKILCNKANTILVGGSEKISNSSYTLHFMKKNIKNSMKQNIPYYQEIENNIMENDMVYISEYLSRKFKITRKMQDDFTIGSIKKATLAYQNGYYTEEIVPISYAKENQRHYLAVDELLLNERSKGDIYNASSMFVKDGYLTQYNAAPMCDCATSLILMNYDMAVSMGIKPLALITDTASIGVEKEKIGQAMSICVKTILQRNGLGPSDIDLYEINESFAAQAIFTVNNLNLEMNRINVNGGNLAFGYPIGTTGLRMSISLIYEMIRRKVRYGLSVMSAGGNMANATILENVF